MKLLETLTHLVPAPAAKTTCHTPAPKSEPTLLQRGSDAIRDLFVPGHQGEKARIHSQYQLCKKLGVHQSRDAQSYSQDAISQTGRAVTQVRNTVSRTVHGVSAGTQEALTVAGDFYRDEAKTATGAYRALIGAGQGAQITAQGLFSTAKNLTKLGLASSRFTYHGLKGDVNFQELLRKGSSLALVGAARGALYVASGRLPDDVKKFSKDCADYTTDYLRKVKNDPGLEVPKLLAIVGTAAALGGGAKLLNGVGKVGGALETAAGTQAPTALAEGVAASQAAPVAAVEETLASQAAPALEEAAACAPQPTGDIVLRGYAQRQATGSWRAATSAEPATGNIVPPGYTQRGAAALEKATECAPRSAPAAPVRVAPPSAPAAPVAAPAPPVAPAPVELGPSTLPLPTKTTFCMPSNSYAPLQRNLLKMSEPLESMLDLKV